MTASRYLHLCPCGARIPVGLKRCPACTKRRELAALYLHALTAQSGDEAPLREIEKGERRDER